MMKHVVLLAGSYYPYLSAVGNCCFNIAEELKVAYKVTVVCMKSRVDQTDTDEYNGQRIIRVSHKRFDYRLSVNERINKSSGIRKKGLDLLLLAIRGEEYLRLLILKTSLNKNWISAYRQALDHIHMNEPVNAVIPFCMPMEAVAAGLDFKNNHRDVSLIPFFFDPFANSQTVHHAWANKKKNARIERDTLERSDVVFCVNHLKQHFFKYRIHTEKIHVTEHPLLKQADIEKNNTRFNSNNINLVYTGMFYKKIRHPEYLLRLISALETEAVLHLYGAGDCGEIIKKYAFQKPAGIINHGLVSKDEANQAVAAADILISIGNADNTQMPSKLFEYMSAGKPIAHFYSIDEDANIGILKDYPLSLCLKQDEAALSANKEAFLKFCRANKDKVLDFGDIERLYHVAAPKYVADQISACIAGVKHNADTSGVGSDAG